MRLHDINVDGFGVLAGQKIEDLDAGLTVIHGHNGAGKTTILHFLRGLFCGFDEARRLKLLPPLKGGTAGGSALISSDEVRASLIRHARPDNSDTLAIHVRRGESTDAQRLRDWMAGLDSGLIHSLYTVGNLEAHAVGDLVSLALRRSNKGTDPHFLPIDLVTQRKEAPWIASQIEHVRQERNDMLQGEPNRGPVAELESRRDRLQADIAALNQSEKSRHETHAAAVAKLREQIAHIEQEIEWLLTEIGGCEADLTDCQDRLWSQKTRSVRETQYVQQEQRVERSAQSLPASTQRLPEVELLDQQIANCRAVLCDLAASRAQLTVESAAWAGAETPDLSQLFARQRTALSAMERQLLELAGWGRELAQDSTASCQCAKSRQLLDGAVTLLRTHIYTVCQDISRGQAEVSRTHLLYQRDGVDRCEAELHERIGKLRSRRDLILTEADAKASTSANQAVTHRIVNRDGIEAQHCGCVDHQSFAVSSGQHVAETHMAAVAIHHDREITESRARATDATHERHLLTWRPQLRDQLERARHKLRTAWQDLTHLLANEPVFAADQRLQELRTEHSIIDEQLHQARNQWQSLSMLQLVLQRAEKKLNVEVQPRVIQEASQMLRDLTSERLTGFEFDPVRKELFVREASGKLLPMQALSRGTLDQAALSFRLALVDEYARRGFTFPLILDDVLVDSDEGRLQAAVRVLQAATARGRQILFFTCQDHLADMFNQLGVTVRSLDGLRWRQSPPAPHFRLEPARKVDGLGFRVEGQKEGVEGLGFRVDGQKQEVEGLGFRVEGQNRSSVLSTTARTVVQPATIIQQLVEHTIRLTPTARDSDFQPSTLNHQPLHSASQPSTLNPQPLHSAPQPSTLNPQPLLSVPQPSTLNPQPSSELEIEQLVEFVPAPRTRPDIPFWLQADSTLNYVPSIGAQMARRLGTIGVSTVSDLVGLDPEAAQAPLSSLQVSAARLRIWQAEARLLSCVPDMSGRDAQLLVACGILNPAELAESSSDQLLHRIERMKGTDHRGWFQWIRDSATSPSLDSVKRWIAAARRARNFREACQDVGLKQTARLFPDAGTTERDPVRTSGKARRTSRSTRKSPKKSTRTRSNVSTRTSFDHTAHAAQESGSLRFYLEPTSAIVDAPSIGPKIATRLQEIGISSVQDFLSRPAGEIAAQLGDTRFGADTMRQWQQQSELMCRVPELRGHDAQILVACDVTTAERLATSNAQSLWEAVGPFVKSKDGQRLLRSSTPPDFHEVTDWIRYSQNARPSKAA